ncbi:hypothetical protein V7S43_007700 [Phytophthora oleae]|uniref:RCC1-like domain-containing protein n=1 Tax=Phytophthora oleae TaxID=2107226 RepID=A0ABD3FNN2_9STRA
MECRCFPLHGLVTAGNGLFNECVSPTGRTFVTVDGGDTFTIGVVADSGELVGWGRAFYGELPGDSAVENDPFVKLKLPERCKAVACGSNHVVVLTDSGRVMAWGWNKFGQVGGSATEEVVRSPTVVNFPFESVQIAAVAGGGAHSLAIDSSGRTWAWGSNDYGQLGIDSKMEQLCSPTLVALPANARARYVAAGWAHSALISTSGEVFTFGWGLYNQLGHGSTQNELKPVAVDALQGLDSEVIQVACGNWHTAVLTKSGDLYSWGWGKDGQLGHEPSITTQVLPRVVNVSSISEASDEAQDVTAIACGNRFTLALCRDRSVQYWGPRSAGSTLQGALTSPKSSHPGWLPYKLAAGSSHAIVLVKPKE